MVKRASVAVLLLALAVPLAGIAVEGQTLPKSYLEKVGSMPDFQQRDASIPGGGEKHCGPTAMANVLVWLDQNGLPNIVPDSLDQEAARYELINCLGVLMDAAGHGSGPLDAMVGTENLLAVRDHWANMEWKGWRDGGRYAVGLRPDLEWVFGGVIGQSNVLLELGFYRHYPEIDTYERTGGHWVTMVGYEGADEAQPRIIVHDPSRARGPVYYRPRRIATGTFAKWGKYEAGPAEGWHILGTRRRGDAVEQIVLDGALRIRVGERGRAESP